MIGNFHNERFVFSAVDGVIFGIVADGRIGQTIINFEVHVILSERERQRALVVTGLPNHYGCREIKRVAKEHWSSVKNTVHTEIFAWSGSSENSAGGRFRL